MDSNFKIKNSKIKKIGILAVFLITAVFVFFNFQSVLAVDITWTERYPPGGVAADKDWQSVASDSDGTSLIAGVYNGRLYTSSNSGVNWTERQPVGGVDNGWSSVSSDSDGSNLIAGVYLGYLYTSSNSGVGWTERQPAGEGGKWWFTLTSDSDGSNIIAGIMSGRLYTSSNSGVDWTERYPPGGIAANKGWYSAASDSDGSNLIVASSVWAPFSIAGRLYTSSNSGVDWTERQPAGNNDVAWHSVASDSDGSHLIAAVFGGRLYTSSNSGVDWTERYPPGGVAANKNWQSVASDSTGTNLIAAIYGGRLYTSSNSGVDWTERQPAGVADKNWQSVSSDSIGSNFIAGVYGGRLYTGIANLDSTPPVPSNFSPATGTTITDSTPTITFDTDETADCFASTDGDETYDQMADDTDCTVGTGTSHSCTMGDLEADGVKNIYIACEDTVPNKDTVDTNELLTYTLDTTSPVPSNFSPINNATIADSTPTITFDLNTNGDCFASIDGDESYDQMADDTDCTGDAGTSITCQMADLGTDGTKNIYISCRDTPGNKDTALTNELITYILDTSVPVPVTYYPIYGGNSFSFSSLFGIGYNLSSIQNLIKKLQSDIHTLYPGSSSGTGITIGGGNGTTLKPASTLFNKDLRLGDINEDVRFLQKFFNFNNFIVSNTGPGSQGKETNIFGNKTKQALIKFQEAYKSQILAPLGYTKGTGMLGPSTRKFINGLRK